MSLIAISNGRQFESFKRTIFAPSITAVHLHNAHVKRVHISNTPLKLTSWYFVTIHDRLARVSLWSQHSVVTVRAHPPPISGSSVTSIPLSHRHSQSGKNNYIHSHNSKCFDLHIDLMRSSHRVVKTITSTLTTRSASIFTSI